jgi:hypothetical protein
VTNDNVVLLVVSTRVCTATLGRKPAESEFPTLEARQGVLQMTVWITDDVVISHLSGFKAKALNDPRKRNYPLSAVVAARQGTSDRIYGALQFAYQSNTVKAYCQVRRCVKQRNFKSYGVACDPPG